MALQQLSAQDAQFLYMQTANALTHIISVNVYDPATAPGSKVRLKDIIEHVRSRLHISPVFKRKLFHPPMEMDHPYWVEDEHFDVEAHISHARLPEPGDWRQMCIFIARLHSRPMDMSRPLWDMTVLEGLDGVEGLAKGSYAVMTRIHHAAADGASVANFFVALSDRDAKGTPAIEMPVVEQDYGDKPTLAEMWSRSVTSNMTSPVKMANSAARFAPAIFDAARKNLRSSGDNEELRVPQTRFNGPISPHKMFDALVVPLADLKAIKKKVEGATINDVVLTVCGGALRRYLAKHKELPEKSLIAWCPINLRQKGDAQEKVPGNQVSAMNVELGTQIAKPWERLVSIRNITREGKAGKSGLSARVMTDLGQHVPGATMAAVARLMNTERFTPKVANAFISNVPGPQIQLYMNGALCTHSFGLAPLANGMGMFIATPSYAGNLTFCLISDRQIMPDIAFFRECLQESVEELKDSNPSKSVLELSRQTAPHDKPPVAKSGSKPRGNRVKEINP